MLQHLHIRNYALISELDIDFTNGLSVLTGETGAGKSIILGALGLVMGNRADTKSITEGETKCVIEATFQLDNDNLQAYFCANELDYDKNCVIRREITTNGKSRVFINDTPVALSVLKNLTEQLIDIHSQHENLLLKDDIFQLSVVDSVARNKGVKAEYEQAYSNYKHIENQLIELRRMADSSKADYDYLLFQFKQLDDAKLQSGEETELEKEQTLLEHAEEIKTALGQTADMFADENRGVLTQLKEALSVLKKIMQYLPAEYALTDRIESAYIDLKDIASTADDIAQTIEYDPERQQQVTQRLDLINSLLLKHRKQNTDELISLYEQLGYRLHQTDSFDEQIADLQKQLSVALQTLQHKADKLTLSRQNAIPQIKQTLEQKLSLLAVRHAQIDVDIKKCEFTESGQDNVQFMFAANLNQQMRAVAEVASGGEIARLMLCIKALIANQTDLQTIIFDEIDTGVSGEVASNMGDMMLEIATDRQVLCITHLPQIACKGTQHYVVYKTDAADRTETHIRRLQPQERISEIAKLLSGDNITPAALENAKDMLGKADFVNIKS